MDHFSAIRWYLLITAFITFTLPVLPDNDSAVIDNFESYGAGKLFSAWRMRTGTPESASRVYSLARENRNTFLRASTRKNPSISIQLAKQVRWDIRQRPFLSWKWRAMDLQSGADESLSKKNDSAASLYVVFKKTNIPLASWRYQPVDVIKYVWSSSLPKGKIIHKKPRTKMGVTYYEGKFIVLQSGAAGTGTWITEKRNVLDDFRKVFGREPACSPMLIGILTDSNATKSMAAADYDDIVISGK